MIDYYDADLLIVPTSAWTEERIKRIRSSKLNQFWHDLFPGYVLYKVDENEIQEDEEKQIDEYVKEKVRTTLTQYEEDMLTNRALRRHKSTPLFSKE